MRVPVSRAGLRSWPFGQGFQFTKSTSVETLGKKSPTSLRLWSNLLPHLPINFIYKPTSSQWFSFHHSLRILPFLKQPSSSTVFRLNMLNFNEILFLVSSCYWDTWRKQWESLSMQKPTRLTLKGSRSKKIVKQYLATGQNFTLGTWIFEDFQLQTCQQPAHHKPPKCTLVLCGWCDLCAYTGIFQGTLHEQPHLPLR